jgi:septum formation inhibitor MinC
MLIIFLLFWHNSAISAIYKWVDANGKVHYSDKKISQAPATVLKPAPKANQEDIAQAQEKTNRLKQQVDKAKQVKLQQEQKQKEDEVKMAQKKKKCLNVMDDLEHLKSTPKIYYKDEKGEKVFYDDNLRKEVNERYKQTYDENCSDQDFYK